MPHVTIVLFSFYQSGAKVGTVQMVEPALIWIMDTDVVVWMGRKVTDASVSCYIFTIDCY